MLQDIISEQKDVRLSLVIDDLGAFYSVDKKNKKNSWLRVAKFNTTNSGIDKAMCLYFRLIIRRIDANIMADIDNDIMKYITCND